MHKEIVQKTKNRKFPLGNSLLYMAPSPILQIFLRVTIQNQIGIAQRVIVNKPLEYAQMVLRGEMEYYLSLGCYHGRLED